MKLYILCFLWITGAFSAVDFGLVDIDGNDQSVQDQSQLTVFANRTIDFFCTSSFKWERCEWLLPGNIFCIHWPNVLVNCTDWLQRDDEKCRLTLPRATADTSAGTFECRLAAVNAAKESNGDASVGLSVIIPAELELVDTSSSLQTSVGSELHLTCKATAESSVDLIWTIRDQSFQGDEESQCNGDTCVTESSITYNVTSDDNEKRLECHSIRKDSFGKSSNSVASVKLLLGSTSGTPSSGWSTIEIVGLVLLIVLIIILLITLLICFISGWCCFGKCKKGKTLKEVRQDLIRSIRTQTSPRNSVAKEPSISIIEPRKKRIEIIQQRSPPSEDQYQNLSTLATAPPIPPRMTRQTEAPSSTEMKFRTDINYTQQRGVPSRPPVKPQWVPAPPPAPPKYSDHFFVAKPRPPRDDVRGSAQDEIMVYTEEGGGSLVSESDLSSLVTCSHVDSMDFETQFRSHGDPFFSLADLYQETVDSDSSSTSSSVSSSRTQPVEDYPQYHPGLTPLRGIPIIQVVAVHDEYEEAQMIPDAQVTPIQAGRHVMGRIEEVGEGDERQSDKSRSDESQSDESQSDKDENDRWRSYVQQDTLDTCI